MSNLVPRNAGDNFQAMFGRLVGNNPNKYLTYDAAKKHAKATGNVIRSSGEGAVVGALLGVVNASRADGLDIRLPNTTKVGAPIDGLAALVLGIGAIVAAQEEYSVDLANGAAAAATIFSFRKTSDMVTEMNIKKSGATPGGGAAIPGKISKASFGFESSRGWATGSLGSQSEDPIVLAGKRL